MCLNEHLIKVEMLFWEVWVMLVIFKCCLPSFKSLPSAARMNVLIRMDFYPQTLFTTLHVLPCSRQSPRAADSDRTKPALLSRVQSHRLRRSGPTCVSSWRATRFSPFSRPSSRECVCPCLLFS